MSESKPHVIYRVWGTILSTFKELHYFLAGLAIGVVLGLYFMGRLIIRMLREVDS